MPILISGSAPDYIDVVFSALSKKSPGIKKLVEDHNAKHGDTPFRGLVLSQAQEVLDFYKSTWKRIGEANQDTNIWIIQEKVADEVKMALEVIDFPLEALTAEVEEIGIPLKSVNPCIRARYRWMFQFVIKTEGSLNNIRGLGPTNIPTLIECVKACGLDFLGPEQGTLFLKRDFRFHEFYKKVTGCTL